MLQAKSVLFRSPLYKTRCFSVDLMLTLIERLLTFKPNRIDHGGLSDIPHQRLRLGLDLGMDLDGVWLPAESPVAVLFIHGNRHNVTRFRDHYLLFRTLGLSCLAFDFPGYGSSKGTPSEASVYASARAAFAHLTDSLQIPSKRIAIYGCSLGGAIAVELAQNVSCGCLITESTFTNSSDMARHLYPYLLIRHLLPTRFANDSKIPSIATPKLIIHGQEDERVPSNMAARLFALANDPKELLMIEDAGHVDCVARGGQRLLDTVRTFINRHCL